jgi:hypothetical protein
LQDGRLAKLRRCGWDRGCWNRCWRTAHFRKCIERGQPKHQRAIGPIETIADTAAGMDEGEVRDSHVSQLDRFIAQRMPLARQMRWEQMLIEQMLANRS